MTRPDDESLGRHYTVTAEARVTWEGEDRGPATWFFYRDDPLPEDLDALWLDAGIWGDDFRWDPAAPLGEKFFGLCRSELLTIGEANRVVTFARKWPAQWGAPVVQRIDDSEIRGELPVRMVWSDHGTVVHGALPDFSHRLGFPVRAFAEPADPRAGRPLGWYGWPCRRNDMS